MADTKNSINSNEMNLSGLNTGISLSGKKIYEIHVGGQLDSRWSEWLGGLEMRFLDNGDMLLFGPIIDQAALMGVLNKLNRLNLALLSINEIEKK